MFTLRPAAPEDSLLYKVTRISLMLGCLLGWAVGLVGQEADPVRQQGQEFLAAGKGYADLFEGDLPTTFNSNFFGYAFADDQLEPRAVFNVSVKYPFVPRRFGRRHWGVWGDSNLYFAYTGKYDFFLFSRESAPVVSRQQNPGLFLDFDGMRKQWGHLALPTSVKLGYFHESNGQTVGDAQTYAATPHAQDYVSRGWDYTWLALDYAYPLWLPVEDIPRWLVIHERGRDAADVARQDALLRRKQHEAYALVSWQWLNFLDKQGGGSFWREEDVFWEKVDRQPTRSHYDGLRLKLSFEAWYYRISGALRCGTLAYDNDLPLSYEFQATLKFWGLFPLSFRVHHGYGPDLAYYHVKNTTYALGLDFY